MTIDTSYEDIRYEVLRECREKLAEMMLRLSIPTGHGDTFDDLLRELEAALNDPKPITAQRQFRVRISPTD